MKIISREDIQALENYTIKSGVPALELMERAGWKSFEYLLSHIHSLKTKTVWICCGPGNNGGDGLVLARYLLDTGIPTYVLMFSKDGTLKTKEGRENIQRIPAGHIQWIKTAKDLKHVTPAISQKDVLIDAVLGIGLCQKLSGLFLEYVKWVNQVQKKLSVYVCAMDIPTGLDADSGESLGGCVQADVTLSFEFYKKGFYQGDGLEKTGKIVCLPIGVLWNESKLKENIFHSLEPSTLPEFPKLSKSAHKKNRGHAYIIAGSREKSGAAVLCSLAAMRAGTGLTTLALPANAHVIVKKQLIDVMSEEIDCDATGKFTKNGFVKLLQNLSGKTAILMGPGLAPDSKRQAQIEFILKTTKAPLVIDAQALSDLGKSISKLSTKNRDVIITPHPGEMSKLTGLSTEQIQNQRFDIAQIYAKQWNVTIILKGNNTIIATPTGEVWVNQVDHPCLSVAGTGDVLAGIVTSLLAQGLSPIDACKLGVYIHGRTGERWGNTKGIRGMLASDLVAYIPETSNEIYSNQTA
jgi:hydroxyethylthiazole kinase-like uncharacterized protein yjeF